MLEKLCLIADVQGVLDLVGTGKDSNITLDTGSKILYFPGSNRIEFSVSIGGSAQQDQKETIQFLKDELLRTELRQYAKLQASIGYKLSLDLYTFQWSQNPSIMFGLNSGYSLGDAFSLFQYGIWNYNKRDVFTTYVGARYQMPGMTIPLPNVLNGLKVGGRVSIALEYDTPLRGMATAGQLEAVNGYKNIFADANEEVIQLTTRTLEWNPNNVHALLSRAIANDRLGKHDLFLLDARRILEVDPSYFTAEQMAVRAHALAATGQPDRALEEASRSLRRNPTVAHAYVVGAIVSEQKKDVGSLIQFATRAIELDLQNAYAYRLRAHGNWLLGNIDAGIQDATSALHWESHPYAYFVRAILHYSNRQFDRAFEDLDQSIRMSPWSAHCWGRRALWECLRGNYQKAIVDADECLRLAPDEIFGLTARYISMAETGRIAEALRDARSLLVVDPSNEGARQFVDQHGG